MNGAPGGRAHPWARVTLAVAWAVMGIGSTLAAQDATPADMPAGGEKSATAPAQASAAKPEAPAEQPAPSAASGASDELSPDELYEQGKALFDAFAPPEVKEQYEFPTREQWDTFVAKLQHALESDDLRELAVYEPEARAALATLRSIPGTEDYADWLEERIDYIEAAKQATQPGAAPAVVEAPTPKPGLPAPPPTPPAAIVPYYDLWLSRVSARPKPERADTLMPVLREAFAAEGVPPEIAWLAEAESTLNPAARSPAGAKGLFQLMPTTAKALGLSTFLPDERTDAEKSARAAARYLRTLHDKFGTWPLAFAAYNAGEGRVRRLLEKRRAATFAAIAAALPSETRMYVPKVCATIAVRTGVTPAELAKAKAG